MSDNGEREVIVTFKLDRSEFFRIWRALQPRPTRSWGPASCGIAFLALGLLISSSTLVVIGAVLAVWWTAYVYVFFPRRLWKRLDQVRDTQKLTFTESEVKEDLLQISAVTDWNYWAEVTRAGDAYVLRSKRGYTFVPCRAFATKADEQRFCRFAASGTGAKLS